MSPLQPLTHAIESFSQYYTLSHAELSKMRSTLARVPRMSKRIAYEVGYTQKLNLLEESISLNARLTHSLSVFGRDLFARETASPPEVTTSSDSHSSSSSEDTSYWTLPSRLYTSLRTISSAPFSLLGVLDINSLHGYTSGRDQGDLHQVRDTLRHMVRDWSEEGREERRGSMGLILDVVRRLEGTELQALDASKTTITASASPQASGTRKRRKVLVPGSGLGRLAWEMAQLGYDTTALDISPYSHIALHYLLSPEHTPKVGCHELEPWAYSFSHSKSVETNMRSVRIPDVLPHTTPASSTFPPPSPPPETESPGPLTILRSDFLAHPISPKGTYTLIPTLFFIDTAPDIVSLISHIHDLLVPGGLWINLGPLLWTCGQNECMAMSEEEVRAVVEACGFEILGAEGTERDGGIGGWEEVRSRTVRCSYTADKQALMTYEYHTLFWVARKRTEGPL